MEAQTYHTDVLVIGGGAAGLRASIEAKRRGCKVLLASKALIGYASSTMYAGGGFRAALGGYTQEKHFGETIMGGKLLNDQELVRTMVLEAPERLMQLEDFGVIVRRRDIGINVTDGPVTPGKGLVLPMTRYAKEIGVGFIENVMAIDILVDDAARGAIFLDIRNEKIITIVSKVVVVATGGYSQLFARTDNPIQVSGDGCAMALRAGAVLSDLEFTQFFPLGLAEPGRPAWLIPAYNARLTNSLNEDVLSKHQFSKPLSKAAVENRDMLSRSMWTEITQGNGIDETLIMDVSDIPENQLGSLFVLEVKRPRFRVAPTAHFTMGGVMIDKNCRTNINGLLACGEVTSGVHGANRLGGNALTEAIVYGARAGIEAYEESADRAIYKLDESQVRKEEMLISQLRRGRHSTRNLKRELQREMWTKCGVMRDKSRLEDLLSFIKEKNPEAEDLAASNALEDADAIQLRNMFQVAEVVARSALIREESRGAHFRSDFPEQNDNTWLKRVTVSGENNRLSMSFAPVELTYLSLKCT